MTGIGDNSRRLTTAERLAEDYEGFLADVNNWGERAKELPATVASDAALVAIADVVKDGRSILKRMDGARTAEVEPHLTAQREINAWFKAIAERVEKTNGILVSRSDDYQRRKAAEARRKAEEEARLAREEAERQRKLAEEAAAKAKVSQMVKAENRADDAEDRARRAEAQSTASVADLTRTRSTSGTVVSAKTELTFRITDWNSIDLPALRPYLKRDAVEAAIRSFMKIQGASASLAGVEFYEDVKSNIR